VSDGRRGWSSAQTSTRSSQDPRVWSIQASREPATVLFDKPTGKDSSYIAVRIGSINVSRRRWFLRVAHNMAPGNHVLPQTSPKFYPPTLCTTSTLSVLKCLQADSICIYTCKHILEFRLGRLQRLGWSICSYLSLLLPFSQHASTPCPSSISNSPDFSAVLIYINLPRSRFFAVAGSCCCIPACTLTSVAIPHLDRTSILGPRNNTYCPHWCWRRCHRSCASATFCNSSIVALWRNACLS
jgi:hypothetical protein